VQKGVSKPKGLNRIAKGVSKPKSLNRIDKGVSKHKGLNRIANTVKLINYLINYCKSFEMVINIAQIGLLNHIFVLVCHKDH
jgi:hypothetical protein